MFKYSKELQKLSNIPEIEVLSNLKPTNTQYEKIIKPFYNWIAKYKIMYTMDFNVRIGRIDGIICIILLPHYSGIPGSIRLEIPPTLRNIVSHYDEIKLIIYNKDSLLVTESLYENIIYNILNNVINPNSDVYIAVEKFGIKQIKSILSDINNILENRSINSIESIDNKIDQLDLIGIHNLLKRHHEILNIEHNIPNIDQRLNTIIHLNTTHAKNKAVKLDDYTIVLNKYQKYLTQLLNAFSDNIKLLKPYKFNIIE